MTLNNANSRIIISGPEFEDVNYSELIKFIKNYGFSIKREEDLLMKMDTNLFTKRMAEIRVLEPDKKYLNENPFPIEIDYEKRNLKSIPRKKGIVYSGNHFLKILQEKLNDISDLKKNWPVYLSDQLLATFEARWHIRVMIFGFPVVISVPGIVYGPARSREYYVSAQMGIPETDEDYIREKDRRKTEVLKGYLFQAIYFYKCLLEGKEFKFCENKGCSLYNSHWQNEIFSAQLRHNLCEKHLKEITI